MGWFKNFTSTLRLRKLENEVVQLRAEYEVFRTETLHELTTTINRISKRIQTRTKRADEDEPEPKAIDPFDSIRELSTDNDLSKEKIGL